jgi:FtsZ-binding cell division protein ZapB
VDPDDVLDSFADPEVSTWEFTDTDDGRHIGPMAGEFHDAFGLGDDDETIASVDADGVALAAIQGLTERVQQKDDRIDEQAEQIDDLEAENERLRERQEALEERLAALEASLDEGDGEEPA